MKKIILLACFLLVTGCGAKYPESTNINLELPTQSSSVYTDSTASVRGHDARETPEIVVFKVKKKPVVTVSNIRSPHIVITERIAGGLGEQGLQFEKDSPVHILIEINKLLVSVSKPKLLYNSQAVSHVTLKVSNRETSLTRKYKREANHESVSRPKIDEIEKMLNDQLSNIVSQILSDTELREMIKMK